MPVWIKDKLFQKSALIKELKSRLMKVLTGANDSCFLSIIYRMQQVPITLHHLIVLQCLHLMVLVSGQRLHSLLVKEVDLKVVKEIHFPHSLGLLYSAFTYYTGFKVNSGEYKVMGLAPYGEPVYADLIREKLITVAEDGSFQLDMSYFDYATGLTMTNKKFDALFGGTPRTSETELTQREMDLAASVQKVTEDIVLS